ncbi:MAG: LysM peptidoglycan-binding domain-containing protein [Chloroflexi bacterium]|nr:LysM peptidoglycan-binding domain-containing protein [Chloroflexota bacterium]
MALQKGKFYNADTKSEVVTCHFNPDELSLSKTNQWNQKQVAGSNLPDVTFGGEGPQQLQMKLVFDSYEKRSDVRDATGKLLKLMQAPDGKNDSRPPHVEFGWGQFRSFRAVLTQFSQTFTLFLENGTPVRANVQVTLQEVPKGTSANRERGQNPTSVAIGARRVRVVQPGDTLDLLAAQELGDPTAWRVLAEANQLDDPRRLQPGQMLLIPSEF